MGVLVGNNLEESRSLLVQKKLSGSRGSQYRERDNIYIYISVPVLTLLICRENIICCLLVLGVFIDSVVLLSSLDEGRSMYNVNVEYH